MNWNSHPIPIETDTYWFLTYLRVQEFLDMTYVNAVKLPRVDIITISISEETEKKLHHLHKKEVDF